MADRSVGLCAVGCSLFCCCLSDRSKSIKTLWLCGTTLHIDSCHFQRISNETWFFFCLFVSFRNIRTKNHTLHILPSLRVSIGIGQPVAHVFVCATIQDLSQNVNNCSSIYFFIVFTSSSFASCLLFSWTLEDASSSCCRSIWSWLEACQKASLKPKAALRLWCDLLPKLGYFCIHSPSKLGCLSPASVLLGNYWIFARHEHGHDQKMRHGNLHRNYETQTVDPAEDRDTDLASSSVSSVSLLSVVFLSFLMLNEYHIITYSNCKSPCISQYRVNAIFLQKLLKHPIQEALPTWQLCFEVPQNDIGIISNLETVLGHLSKNPMKHKISSFSHPIFCKYLQAHIAAAMLGQLICDASEHLSQSPSFAPGPKTSQRD